MSMAIGKIRSCKQKKNGEQNTYPAYDAVDVVNSYALLYQYVSTKGYSKKPPSFDEALYLGEAINDA